MKEMGRKPYLSKSYREMMTKTSNMAIWNQIKQKHSEFEKPYLYKAGEYSEMQHYYPNLPGFSFSDIKFDHPWMNEQVPNVKGMKGVVTVSFPGCEFEIPGLFSGINRCEIKCEVLDERSRWSDGTPTDPIVSWEAKNGTITESDMYHACVRANEDAPYGQWVELIATTKSGATCRGFAWVEGNDCCVPDAAMAWDYGTSAATVARSASVTVAITGNNTPFTWSVSGTGFTLDEVTTTGLTNTLNADASACGSATITVTGCDSKVAIGYVRCTTGQWVIIEKLSEGDSACIGVGAPFWLSGTWWAGIGDKYKVEESIELTHVHGYSPNNLCPGECTPYCSELHPCETCLGVSCAQLGPITPLGNFPCCYDIYPEYDPLYRYYTYCYRVYERILYEWKC